MQWRADLKLTRGIWNFVRRKKFLTKEGKKPKEIHEWMNAVYGDIFIFLLPSKFWSKQFKWGRESIEDDSRSGRPVEASSKGMCLKWRT